MINVDLCDLPYIHYKRSIDDLSCFEDGCADVVYSSYTLEYFDRQEVQDVLVEWRRVSKMGGLLRIAVPDLKALLTLYREKQDINLLLGPLYGRMKIDGVAGNETLYHKTAYDEESLNVTLKKAGFKDIKRYEWQKTEHVKYDDHSQAYYPHMDKENGLLLSLNMEAVKC